MPAHITVLCCKPVEPLRVAALRRELDRADLRALGESYGDMRAEDIAAAVRSVEVEGDDAAGLAGAEIRYGEGRRPIQLSVLEGEVLAEVVAELSEALAGVSAPDDALARVRACLAGARVALDVELGWSQTEDMGAVFAELAAFWVARQTDGLANFYDEAWYAPEDRVTPLVKLR